MGESINGEENTTIVFGYGSILWKQEFEYIRSYPCYITGYKRVFYQGSTDHRGVPGKPGRVVTLIKSDPQSRVAGLAFQLPNEPSKRNAILAQLDHRERGGYDRVEVTPFCLHTDTPLQLTGNCRFLCYLATEENCEYLGHASEEEIAANILASEGHSGPNREYLFKLADSLRELEDDDPHVFAVEAAAKILQEKAHAH